MGYSTLENILHCKVVSWEPELPETRIVTIRTPCYVHVYILHIMKQSVGSLMTARFAIEGVLKLYTVLFHAC